MKAYHEGYNACYRCQHIDTCPYAPGTIERDQWRYGWLNCQAEYQDED